MDGAVSETLRGTMMPYKRNEELDVYSFSFIVQFSILVVYYEPGARQFKKATQRRKR